MIEIKIDKGKIENIDISGTMVDLVADTAIIVKSIHDSIVSTIIVEDKNPISAIVSGSLFIKAVLKAIPHAVSFEDVLKHLNESKPTDINKADETPENKENMPLSEFMKQVMGIENNDEHGNKST